MSQQSLFSVSPSTCRWARVFCALGLAAASSLAQAQLPLDPTVTIVLPDSQQLVVRKLAQGVSTDAWQIAQSLGDIDRKLAMPTSSATGDAAEIDKTLRAMALELRNESAESMAEAFRIQARTSGTLDAVLMATSSARAAEAKAALAATPMKLFVDTDITSSAPGAFLQYMLAGEFKLNTGSWSSYTAGDKLHIGNYMFRLCAQATGTELYKEYVLVTKDPTVRIIHIAAHQ